MMEIPMMKRLKRSRRTVTALAALVAGISFLFPAWSVAVENTDLPERMTEARARRMTITEWYEAVGTVRPRTESSIGAQVTGQVLAVHAKSGDRVEKGRLLAVLDSRQFASRLDQARQGLKTALAGAKQADQAVAAAKAALAQADSAYQRVKKYFESQAATEQDLEQAKSAYLQAVAGAKQAEEARTGAEAGIKQAREVVNEAEIAMGYTEIRSPEDAEVLRRLVEQGDLAMPGKPLFVLQTSGTLRLEAFVREGMIRKAHPGGKFSVLITTLDKTVEGTVEEVVPYADPATRTFMVKVAIPPMEGLYPGMYGKMLIPVRETEVVLAPASAVIRVGQLEFVAVKGEGGFKKRLVKTGQAHGADVEILSGLTGDEIIGIGEPR